MAKVSDKQIKDAEEALRTTAALPTSDAGVSWNPYRAEPFMSPADSEKAAEDLAKGGQDTGATAAVTPSSTGTP